VSKIILFCEIFAIYRALSSISESVERVLRHLMQLAKVASIKGSFNRSLNWPQYVFIMLDLEAVSTLKFSL